MEPGVDPLDCVLAILSRKTGIELSKIRTEASLLHDLRIDGDDAVEVILELSSRCGVDVSSFDCSRYFRSEPALGWLLPTRESTRDKACLTVQDLVEGVRRGKLA